MFQVCDYNGYQLNEMCLVEIYQYYKTKLNTEYWILK